MPEMIFLNNNNNNNNSNNKRDIKVLSKRTRNKLFKLKRKKIGKSFYKPARNNLFEPEKDYYKSVKIGNAFSSNYIEYENNGDKDKTLSIKHYLDGIKPYFSDIINDQKTQGEWKIHLTMTINFFCS